MYHRNLLQQAAERVGVPIEGVDAGVQGSWITNIGKRELIQAGEGKSDLRFTCKVSVGWPKATGKYTLKDIVNMGLVGLYRA